MTVFRKILQYRISLKSFYLQPSCSIRADRHDAAILPTRLQAVTVSYHAKWFLQLKLYSWYYLRINGTVLVHLASKFTSFYLEVQPSYFIILTADSDICALPLSLPINIYTSFSPFFLYSLYIIHMDFIISHWTSRSAVAK